MTRRFSDPQRQVLLAPIKPGRVLTRDGQSHLPAYDVVAHLNRMFGFEGWDKEIKHLELVFEFGEMRKTSSGRERIGWDVCYRCEMRLFIYDQEGNLITFKDDGATGDAVNMPSRADAHDFALKNSISYALKRCAKDLGDQFGLSLYNKGQVGALVKAVVPYGGSEVEPPPPLSMGNDERDHGAAEVTPLFEESAEQNESIATHPAATAADLAARAEQIGQGGTPATVDQLQQLGILLSDLTDDDRHTYLSAATGRVITSAKELTKREASIIIPVLRDEKSKA